MNPWEASTTYTPASGLGSAFKWGLNDRPQGLSQGGWNALGGAMAGMGKGMLMQNQGAFSSPAMGLAQGLGDGMQQRRLQQFSPPQGAFGAQGGGMGQQMAPIFNLKGLFGG